MEKKKRACVIVLGDFGRSPRMQYHTLSLEKHNFYVDVIAYPGSTPLELITENQNIKINYMKEVPKFEKYLSRIIVYALKTIWQSIFLFWSLFKLPKSDYILVQNPPSLPTLPVTWFFSWVFGCYLIIDFHNYGFTLLGLTLRENHMLVKICKWCEKYFGRKANQSICVTKAMQEDLMLNWNIKSSVFYDCAPDIFHPITLEEKHNFFMKLSKIYKEFQSSANKNEEKNIFTKKIENNYEYNSERPALILSSTSWTEDEDFSILLSALEDYERATAHLSSLPKLFVAITGKGPLKRYYQKQIENKHFKNVNVITLWLQSEDYPTFLACADLGISLHSSSSGLDLPMKVVDMFGSGLPVCALSFKCIDELVKDQVNGLIFSTSKELSNQLQHLFSGFPEISSDLNKFKINLKESNPLRWEENWHTTVYPLFQELTQ